MLTMSPWIKPFTSRLSLSLVFKKMRVRFLALPPHGRRMEEEWGKFWQPEEKGRQIGAGALPRNEFVDRIIPGEESWGKNVVT